MTDRNVALTRLLEARRHLVDCLDNHIKAFAYWREYRASSCAELRDTAEKVLRASEDCTDTAEHRLTEAKTVARLLGVLATVASMCLTGCFDTNLLTPVPESPCADEFIGSQAFQPRHFPLTVELNRHLSNEQEHAAIDAISAWNEDLGAEVFEFANNVEQPSKADHSVYIQLGVTDPDHIAHTDRSAGVPWSVITINRNIQLDYDDLTYAMAHELGHALNLPDESDPRFIMAARSHRKQTGELSQRSRCLATTGLVLAGALEESAMQGVRSGQSHQRRLPRNRSNFAHMHVVHEESREIVKCRNSPVFAALLVPVQRNRSK